MNGNVTNLLLAQMLLSSRQPNFGGGRQAGEARSSPAESERVRALRQSPLGFEQTRPEQQSWSEDGRWPTDDAFEPPPLRMLESWERQRRSIELQRLIEEQQRQKLYQEGVGRLRSLIEEEQERERKDRLQQGESMIG